MAKFKFDAQKAKQLAVEKIEIVAMGICAFLTAIFLIMCVMAVFGSASEDQKILADAKNYKKAIDAARPEGALVKEEDPPSKEKEHAKGAQADVQETAWTDVSPKRYLAREPLYDAEAAGDTKKRNPLILPIDVTDKTGKDKFLLVDYIQSGVQRYVFTDRNQRIDVVQRGGEKESQTPVHDIRPARMAVITAAFPYKEQVGLYLKALRIEKTEDLFSKGLAPILTGVNVLRRSYDPSTKETSNWEPIYVRFPANKDSKEEKELTAQLMMYLEQGSPGEKENKAKKESKVKVRFITDAEPKDSGWKVAVSEAVYNLLMDSVYDTNNVQKYAHEIWPMVFSPLPQLADRPYPKFPLPGFDPDEDAVAEAGKTPDGMPMGLGLKLPLGGGRPMPKGTEGGKEPAGGRPTVKSPLISKMGSKLFQDRVSGRINPLNPFGLFPPEEKKEGDGKDGAQVQPGVMPPRGDTFNPFGPRPKRGKKGAKETELPPGAKQPDENNYETLMKDVGGLSWETKKTMLRFFDAGLEPGKLYEYSIQVRMLNPNYGKTKEVAFPKLAENKELLSAPVLTPPLVVPPEFHFYAVDQSAIAKDPKNALATKELKKLKKDQTPIDYAPKVVPPHKVAIQIHQWTEDGGESGQTQKICDWVIGERLLFERGDIIGRKNVAVEIPTWDRLRGHFQLGYVELVFAGKDQYKEVRHGHVAVNFGQEDSGPVIVDFVGGKTTYKGISDQQDHGNLDLLLLTSDGKLVVRSSREDADEESAVGAERLHRYDTWRSRLDFYRTSGVSTTPPTKGPGGPPGG